ncbi:diaminopimelate epimerase [Seongchinamella sediminis]|uniref:Diaminopimelate epimerase n=1 Tax=Seongchinamella sediminis TaxID=2283635 RepID=A0A3L7DWL0_9GAMM|nr:diaminopimelate epimerase [Seongchinamella sediminis]RLQ20990.1 diaminopimelate epimerase [Seongchinamella sediminis]
MLLKFTKMHGAGNDFVVIDLISQRCKLRSRDIRKLADRHFGVGCDQVLVVEPPGSPDVDFRYRIYNADGGEVEQCGNGARCFARFVRDKKLTNKRLITVETAAGVIELRMRDNHRVEVNMGAPALTPADIPFDAAQQAESYSLEVGDHNLEIGAVSMGNPHAITRVDEVAAVDIGHLGPLIENHPRFPERVNAGFMELVSDSEINLRVFERGVGETLACGTGACAAVVYGLSRGWLRDTVTVNLPGGKLSISWAGPGQPVIMTGPTASVFEGTIRI